jgi:hypothetical protein
LRLIWRLAAPTVLVTSHLSPLHLLNGSALVHECTRHQLHAPRLAKMCSLWQIADKAGFVHDLLDLNGDLCVRAASMQTRCSKFARQGEWQLQKKPALLILQSEKFCENLTGAQLHTQASARRSLCRVKYRVGAHKYSQGGW